MSRKTLYQRVYEAIVWQYDQYNDARDMAKAAVRAVRRYDKAYGKPKFGGSRRRR